MIELQLLGLQPDGENLTLNDANGNRYSLPINESLRAALRKDIDASMLSNGQNRQMSPREIQALVRQGKSVQEICDISALPAARVGALAHPILAEREYTARTARSFPLGREIGALTVEEVVTSRLLSRGVRPHEIEWDATREAGSPWQLTATFTSADQNRTATWSIDIDRRSLEAIDDEATWLSETQLSRPAGPWRATNTPPVEDAPVRQESESPESAHKIDAVLASLDVQRGKQKPMPTIGDEDFPEPEFAGAHPATSEPAQAEDATILSLPNRFTGELDIPIERPSDSGATLASVYDAPASPEEPKTTAKKKRTSPRPSMPSWDEIVFGKKDD